jgi:large subunit ribosomal protein L5
MEKTQTTQKVTSNLPQPQETRGRLKRRFDAELLPALQTELGLSNPYQVPRLHKIVLNMRLGDVKDNSKSVQAAINELTLIAGQKAVPTKARQSVSNFKVRENQTIGAKVTLRGAIAYEFLDKLVSIVLPRVRDFRGVSDKSFDGRGNYSMGVKEHLIFPEISYELVEKVRGMDISIITTASNDLHALAFLRKVGMPFVKR